MASLDQISIRGFKSIRRLDDFELGDVNVLIGANGAGKSNFIEFFRLLSEMAGKNLAGYVERNGGADGFLFNGPKTTDEISAHFKFGKNEYRFTLQPTVDERFLIAQESQKYELGSWSEIGSSERESRLLDVKDDSGLIGNKGVGYYVYHSVKGWVVYHFHDTEKNAGMRRSEIVQHHNRLESDASNIAPFLRHLRDAYPADYSRILDTLKLALPFFEDFRLDTETRGDRETVKLSWKQKGSDFPMQPYHLSDGSIRFICLATALLQPNPPSTVLVDEPELGLHPYAIELLGELICTARTQVVVSTQSPALVDCFEAEDVVVVSRAEGATQLQRLDSESLSSWLNDYSLGDLWRKNVIQGGPVREWG